MRGNHLHSLRGHRYEGSIPACAGEPSPRGHLRDHQRVYPRVCGGTATLSPVRRVARGLSPRVRGNRYQITAGPLRHGSIPACAGEPATSAREVMNPAVYPRVCGGTNAITNRTIQVRGLSPRVRGNQQPARAEQRQRRSIPACAGEPRTRSRSSSRTPVYPRVCGGTVYPCEERPDARGLSPRVRGNHMPRPLPGDGERSIPACAGEPLIRDAGDCPAGVYPRVCGGTPWDSVRVGCGVNFPPWAGRLVYAAV